MANSANDVRSSGRSLPRLARLALMSSALLLCCAGAFVLGVVAHARSWPIYTVPRVLILGEPAVAKARVGGVRFRKAGTEGSGVTLQTADEVSTKDLETQIRQLEALGYATGTQAANADAGVHADAAADTWTDGRLLLSDGHKPEAILMDMRGNVLHRWAKAYDEAFPGNTVPDDTQGIGYFRRLALLPGGDLLAIYEGQGMVKLDAKSNVLWTYPALVHHDLDVQADGTIFTLTRKAHVVPAVNPDKAVLEDFIVQLSPKGEELKTISVLDAVKRSPYRSLLQNSTRTGDFFHTNTIEVLDGRLAESIPAFKRGNIMLSLHRVHAIVIVDPELGEVVWSMAGMARMQHQPTVIDNGHLMIFDNQGDLGASRVIEVDVPAQRVVWEYSGKEHGFYSHTCGSLQRLPSGETLITESDGGRAFIVTPQGRKVWEYVTPNRSPHDRSLIATLFEVVMLPSEADLSWLANSAPL